MRENRSWEMSSLKSVDAFVSEGFEEETMISLHERSVDLEEGDRRRTGERKRRGTNHSELDHFVEKVFVTSVDRCFDDLFGVVRDHRQRERGQFGLVVQSGDIGHAMDFS